MMNRMNQVLLLSSRGLVHWTSLQCNRHYSVIGLVCVTLPRYLLFYAYSVADWIF